MLSLLAKTEKAVGVKQSLRALRERRVIAVFLAEDVTVRMEGCIRVLKESFPSAKILLVAPVPMVPGTWVTEDRLVRESARLAAYYEELACRLGVSFADAADWDVELLFDGVHFSEAGHRAFAVGIRQALEQ